MVVSKITSLVSKGKQFIGVLRVPKLPKNINACEFKYARAVEQQAASTTTKLSRENVLIKHATAQNADINVVDETYSLIARNLDGDEQQQLLRLIDDGQLNLHAKVKSKRFFDDLDFAEDSLEILPSNILETSCFNSLDDWALFKNILDFEKKGKLSGEFVAPMMNLERNDWYLAKGLNKVFYQLEKGEVSYAKMKSWLEKLKVGHLHTDLRVLPKVNFVSSEATTQFLTKFDDIVYSFKGGRSIDELSQAGGIGLKYSRNALRENILKHVEKLPQSERQAVLSKFGIDDLDNLPVFSQNTAGFSSTELAINKEIEKFLFKNEVILPKGFENYKGAIDEICTTFPEFRYAIGAKASGAHEYNIAEHALKALQENVNNPLYKTLNEADRRVLNISTLLSDVRTLPSERFITHADVSGLTVEAVVRRMNLPVAEQNRIINMVENHHWLDNIPFEGEQYSKFLVENLGTVFRSSNDFTVAKILAESDLKAVSSSLWKTQGVKLNSPVIREIENDIVQNIQSRGRMVYTGDVSMGRALEAGGQKIVLGTGDELTENVVVSAKQLLGDNNACIHGASPEDIINAYKAGRYGVGGVFSTTVAREGTFPTSYGSHFLMTKRLNMDDISMIMPKSRNTKFNKEYVQWDSMARAYFGFSKDVKTKYSELTSKILSDEQYAQLFREIPRDNLNKIHSHPKVIEILGGKKEAQIFEDIIKARNINYSDKFCEAVVRDVQWGGLGFVSQPSEVPYLLRKFAQENNLPLVRCNLPN